MTYREILSEAQRLPLGKRLQLVEELLRAMRQTTTQPVHPERPRTIPFRQLRGALKPGGPLPTDAKLEDAYMKHLLEKYL